MNKFKQKHAYRPKVFVSVPTYNFSIVRPFSSTTLDDSTSLSVDQFFSQSHNLRNGFISTSPELFDDPQTAAHSMQLPSERPLPSDMSVDEIHNMVVSRKIQSPAELAELSKLRPNPSDFEHEVVDVVNDPSSTVNPSNSTNATSE